MTRIHLAVGSMYIALPRGGASKLKLPAGSRDNGPVPLIRPMLRASLPTCLCRQLKKIAAGRNQTDRQLLADEPQGAEPACSRSRPPCAGGRGRIVAQSSS